MKKYIFQIFITLLTITLSVSAQNNPSNRSNKASDTVKAKTYTFKTRNKAKKLEEKETFEFDDDAENIYGEVLEHEKEEKKRNKQYITGDQDEEAEYSPFDDFRIPIRKNISRSELLIRGWKTDSNMYKFRCFNKNRIRLTYWYLETKEGDLTNGSTFINITEEEEEEKCRDTDEVHQERD